MADTPKQLSTIKDANGKEFSIDLTKISDINGDLGNKVPAQISDANSQMLACVHDMEIVDSRGKAIDSAQLIKDMASGKTNVTSIDVEMEATHSGRNLNYCIYYEDSMEKDAETFMNPYHKPILKNHNDYSGEPLGRIKQAVFGPSALTDERSAIHLTAHVTDQDAIPKFIDGRYATVSIGGSMGTVTCNICGKTILKDGKFKWCGHWRGETYKDNVCYWGARDITYHEVSTVNNPADVFAQVMKITVHTDSDDNNDNNSSDSNNNSKEESTMAGTTTNSNATDAATAKKSVCDIIDQLLTGSATPAAAASDNNQTATDGADTATPPATDTATADSATGAADAEDSAKLKKDLADAQAKITDLETQLADSKKNLETAQKEAKDAKDQADSLQDKCIALATANKELVADSIMSKEKFKDDAAKDERKKELMAMSMKDLNKLTEEGTASDSQQRTPGTVSNPTMAGEDPVKDANGAGDSAPAATDSNKENNKPVKTVEDFAQDIVGKLLR